MVRKTLILLSGYGAEKRSAVIVACTATRLAQHDHGCGLRLWVKNPFILHHLAALYGKQIWIAHKAAAAKMTEINVAKSRVEWREERRQRRCQRYNHYNVFKRVHEVRVMSVINTNTAAIVCTGNQPKQRDMATAMERLSTGSRINSAQDDAAGLAISQRMSAQISDSSRRHETPMTRLPCCRLQRARPKKFPICLVTCVSSPFRLTERIQTQTGILWIWNFRL